jgi:putative phosphoesterase
VTRIVLLADTHVRRGSSRRLPDAAYEELERADVVLHAGDVLVPDLLDELSGFAPTHAVLGNNDAELVGVLPERRVVEVDGVRIAMVHDPGPRQGREARLRQWFPDADVVVFGHTHEPLDAVGVDGQRLMNPGSPTERRRQPNHTVATVDVHEGKVVRHSIVVV